MKRIVTVLTAVLAVGALAPIVSAQASAKPKPKPTPSLIIHGFKMATKLHPVLTRPQDVRPAAQVNSGIWAGYSVSASCGTCGMRYVEATFNVPSAQNCTPGTSGSAAVSHWVGLDGGTSTSTTVEQVGVVAICTASGVSYFGFYELFPQPAVLFTGISPGDAVDANVYFNGATMKYDLTLDDLTSGGSIHQFKPCPGGSVCKDSTAEVITEVPNGGPPAWNLANYGMVNYDNASVTRQDGQHGTLTATKSWTSTEFVNVNSATTDILSTPSALFDGQAFSVTWSNPS